MYNSKMLPLRPDYIINNTANLDPEELSDLGVTTVAFDVDGTVAYHNKEIPPDQQRMIERLSKAGLQLYFISNNTDEDRFGRLAPSVPPDAILHPKKTPPSGDYLRFIPPYKPRSRMLRVVMKQANATPSQMMMVGDQLLADVWSGTRASVKTTLVPRLGKPDHLPTRVLLRPTEAMMARRVLKSAGLNDFPEHLTPVSNRVSM